MKDQRDASQANEEGTTESAHLVARHSAVLVKDVSIGSTLEQQRALMAARTLAVFMNASGADITDAFVKLRAALNSASTAFTERGTPRWALTLEGSVYEGKDINTLSVQQFYLSPTLNNPDATIGQLNARAEVVKALVGGKLH